MPKIRVTLGQIDKAIDFLDDYEKKLHKKLERLVQQLAENGADIARAYVFNYGAFNLGDLYGSIAMYREGNKAVIFTDSDHAAFVEFGTGVVGGYNPYPAEIPVGWSYASGQTINPETGAWFFYNETTKVSGWTQGMPSRPFMWDTAVDLRRSLVAVARKVFAEND